MNYGCSEIISYRARAFRVDRPVRVYRNLRRRARVGVWYSVMQGGRVIGHSQLLFMRDATFVVSQSGRSRARREKVSNVHAFVDGWLESSWTPPWRYCGPSHTVGVTYSPFSDVPRFHVPDRRIVVECAEGVTLGGGGVIAYLPQTSRWTPARRPRTVGTT